MSETVAMKGEIKKIDVGDSFEYDVYVPDTITSDTRVIVYEHGGGGYHNDWRPFTKEITTNGSDAIIIHASASRVSTLNLINSTLTEYNLSVNNVTIDGHSAGGANALKDAAELISAYPNEIEAPIITFTDGCLGTIYPTRKEVEVLKNSNAVVLAFVQPGYWQIENYQKLARYGVNVVIAVRKNLTGDDFWKKHAAMNASYISGGLYDFVSGKGELPEGYELITYNPETNKFSTVDLSLINDIDSIYELFDINTLNTKIERLAYLKDYNIKSDSAIVTHYLNAIVRKVRNSQFLNGSFNSFSGSSSTSVPSQIPDVVSDHFNKVANNLTRIVNLTDAIAKIDTSYQELDEKLVAMINKK